MPQYGLLMQKNNVLVIPSKVDSTHLEHEKLRCVLCYPIVTLVRFRKGINTSLPTKFQHRKIIWI
jgi:hypothetical protein